jgi:tocopherol O-methyltransferase
VICAWVSRENPVGWEKRFLLDPICREGRLFQLATEAEHKQLLSDAGFRGITSENATRRVERTWSLCVARTVRAFLFDREARRFLLDSRRSNRVFALTIARLRFAYAIGAMRYHIIGAQYER